MAENDTLSDPICRGVLLTLALCSTIAHYSYPRHVSNIAFLLDVPYKDVSCFMSEFKSRSTYRALLKTAQRSVYSSFAFASSLASS